MKNKLHKEKMTGYCFLLISICYYLSAMMGFFGTDAGNEVVNLCLGSAFLCLSSAHLSKGGEKDGKKQ